MTFHALPRLARLKLGIERFMTTEQSAFTPRQLDRLQTMFDEADEFIAGLDS